MVKLLLQTKELVKELMLEKFAHIIDGEIPKTYPILCKSLPELLHCSYCWLWILPNGTTICMYFIEICIYKKKHITYIHIYYYIQ